MIDPISKAQIAKIWATAHSLGMDREMLYLLVPRGSISAMTRQEAAELIDHLERLGPARIGPRNPDALFEEKPRRRTAGSRAPTGKQRHFIYALLNRLGWMRDPEHVRNFLRKYAHVESVESIATRKRAGAVIEALKAIEQRRHAGTSAAERN